MKAINKDQIKRIVGNITNVLVNEDQYELRKSVEKFHKDEKFLGDFVNFLMVDKNANPPIFYSVASPYDLLSKKDPQHALVWQDGILLLNTDYTNLAALRTGAMDTIALQAMGVVTLKYKKVLLFGTGGTAKWSIHILKTFFDDLVEIDYINSTKTTAVDFEKYLASFGVSGKIGDLDKIGEYDIIICHTNANQPVLTISKLEDLKKGVIITTFLGSDKEHGEIDTEFYSERGNVILDWKKNLKLAKDIQKSNLATEKIIFLKDILEKSVASSKDKDYTIFRFLGTPMQNLGVLQVLLEESKIKG